MIDNPNSSATHVTVGRNGDGDAITGIYHLQRPQQPEWAVNMEYSDEERSTAISETKLMTL